MAHRGDRPGVISVTTVVPLVLSEIARHAGQGFAVGTTMLAPIMARTEQALLPKSCNAGPCI